MNFAFRKAKVIGSLVIPLIIWVFAFIVKGSVASFPGIINSFLGLHDMTNLFGTGNIILFVGEIIVVYMIWSLFQRQW
ncbi:MAG: hypothetical protein AABX88_03065 [Nanoarchaeota archaeon]